MTKEETGAILAERLQQLYPGQTSWTFPEIEAARYYCPHHKLPLKGRYHEVKTGLYEFVQTVLLLGNCPKDNCGYLLDIRMDYSIVMKEGKSNDV